MTRTFLFYVVVVLATLGSCKPARSVIAPSDAEEIVHEVVDSIPAPEVQKAKISFDSSSYHFGVVKKGGVVSRELHFRNTGKQDLLIDLISACECTTLDWPRLAIKPGGRGTIKVRYDSKDKEGPQIVDIEIMANTQPETNYTKFYIFVQP